MIQAEKSNYPIKASLETMYKHLMFKVHRPVDDEVSETLFESIVFTQQKFVE
jgi:hypothetical protein